MLQLKLAEVLFLGQPTEELDHSSQGKGAAPSCYGPRLVNTFSRPRAPASLKPFRRGSALCPESQSRLNLTREGGPWILLD
jgi:hypothetical protein